MKFKGLTFTGIDQMINGENDKRLQSAWKNSLGHQIATSDLPDFKTVREELELLFNKHFATI